MTTIPLSLDGYTDLPPGKIANVVTFFERTEPPAGAPTVRAGLVVRPVEKPTVGWYRALYQRIGGNWLWFSRAVMPDPALSAIISAPTTVMLALERDGQTIGLAEIDFSEPAAAEIVTFGLVPEATGKGAGPFLMEHALAAAFRPKVVRVWLHTCTFDHPAATRFYASCGFRPYRFAVEVSDDPRRKGFLPRNAAPHVPLIE
jgi:GNAT superfamily N-acetyltransferase